MGVFLIGLSCLIPRSPEPPSRAYTREEVLEALHRVESGGRDPCPDGDGGRAIGPFQIFRSYWRDAVEFDPSLGGRYQDCRRRSYAEKVVAAYMRRHVPQAWAGLDAEVIARTHNGGPRGAGRPATRAYWEKVERVLAGAAR